MKIIYAAINTSDFTPGNILELSYIIEEANLVRAFNYFFDVDEVAEELFNIHHLSPDKVEKLSGSRKFKSFAQEIHTAFDDAYILVVYGAVTFLEFMKKEMLSADILFEPEKKTHIECIMTKSKELLRLPQFGMGELRNPSLEETLQHLGVSPMYLSDLAWSLFKEKPESNTSTIYTATACFELAKYFRADLRRMRG